MYTLNRIDNSFSGLLHQQLTFPTFRPLLETLKPEGSTVAIAVSDSNNPIGLAIAAIQPNNKSAEILSIFVEPPYRCQGVGTDLLTRVEQELIFRGCTDVKLIYTCGQPTTQAFERLLQKCQWMPPQPRMLVCKSSRDKIMNAPWMQKTKLPDSYSIFPWAEITEAERLGLQKYQEIFPWIPITLIPFIHEENFEPLNSLGLRYHGELVGWMITHRLSPDTIRYACGFLRPDLQKMGRFIPLLANAIHIQAKANILNGIWIVSVQRNSMVNFVKKRMAPYLTSLKESKESYKSLINC